MCKHEGCPFESVTLQLVSNKLLWFLISVGPTCANLNGLSLTWDKLWEGDWSETPRILSPFLFSLRQACWCLFILSICSSTVIRGREPSARHSCSTALLGLSLNGRKYMDVLQETLGFQNGNLPEEII